MRLVAGALQQLERRAAARQAERLPLTRLVDLLLALGETHDRQLLQAGTPRRVERRAQLPLAAVDDHEIGERLPFGAAPAEVACHDFVHGREIVLRGAPDPEATVLGLLGA